MPGTKRKKSDQAAAVTAPYEGAMLDEYTTLTVQQGDANVLTSMGGHLILNLLPGADFTAVDEHGDIVIKSGVFGHALVKTWEGSCVARDATFASFKYNALGGSVSLQQVTSKLCNLQSLTGNVEFQGECKNVIANSLRGKILVMN